MDEIHIQVKRKYRQSDIQYQYLQDIWQNQHHEHLLE